MIVVIIQWVSNSKLRGEFEETFSFIGALWIITPPQRGTRKLKKKLNENKKCMRLLSHHFAFINPLLQPFFLLVCCLQNRPTMGPLNTFTANVFKQLFQTLVLIFSKQGLLNVIKDAQLYSTMELVTLFFAFIGLNSIEFDSSVSYGDCEIIMEP